MQNLRINNVKIIDSSNIDVTFTDNLNTNLVPANINIASQASNVPDALVLQISIFKNTLSINCQPLTPMEPYLLEFKSIPLHSFESVKGDSRISEDNVSNKFLIIAPLESDNPIKTYLDIFLKDNIYTENEDTLINKYTKSLAIVLSRALYDIRQVKNENYLSFTVTDEQKNRGTGPFDRLNEEGAYQVLRAARTPTGTNVQSLFLFDSFPPYPVSIQKRSNIETLEINSIDELGIFNINTLIFNLTNKPVTKINDITFTLNTASPVYVYNIEKLGYQIKNFRYDQESGFSYLPLKDNQIKISDKILNDPSFSINDILSVTVKYESKNLGVVVDPSSISVYSTTDVIRESTPPITNIFSLNHAPITDISNNNIIMGGISFTNSNSNINEPHPAFVTEIPFRLNALPFVAGQYSVDYSSGTVYVYGQDIHNDGTGPYPPLATYKYRLTYQPEIDYIYDPDSLDLVALPNGNLINSTAGITFNFEEVLNPETDYKTLLHQEVLEERINNKLLALNVLKTNQSPITNVYRIYNETSGEIYSVDRWNDDKIYFRYNVPPRIEEKLGERVSFDIVNNELLFVSDALINSTPNLKIFKILLSNNNIISSTEDGIGASFNSSIVFSDGYLFRDEKWFNRDFNETFNVEKLQNIGEYSIDYMRGIVYVAVALTQQSNLGNVSYKRPAIITEQDHIISVEDLYYRIDHFNPKNKSFSYTSFNDKTITPEVLYNSDEMFLYNNSQVQYYALNGQIGSYPESTFIPGVTNQIKSIRSIFDYNDLNNSTNPINFASVSQSDTFNITIGSIVKQISGVVASEGLDNVVFINEKIPYLSPGIDYNFEVIRLSDGSSLWDNSSTIVPGDILKLILSTANNPITGQAVIVKYTFTIKDDSRLVIDYNKGDYFSDYTYLNDEIIVSYEYGDNVLDFRSNLNLPTGSEYFVSYKVGALRDSLLKNFGTLVNIPELSIFDIDFNRERYREALMAALSSFIQGPTIAAIKNIGKIISHIEPEVTESAFLNWSLGSSLLTPEPIRTTGNFENLLGKYGKGILINKDDQTITIPLSSNLRLEDGTFESWVIPQWNGLDNNAHLTFNITKDGYVISDNEVFVGSAELNPNIQNGTFTVNKKNDMLGLPNFNKDGIFIYLSPDISGKFDRWSVRVIDGYVDGYIPSSNYNITINTTGSFYDSKSLMIPKASNVSILTRTKSLSLLIGGGSPIDEGVTFLSDQEHYLLDFGEEESKNRFSIFKDISGYLNFRIYDRNKISYIVSANISSWKIGDPHHIAASWKLNTSSSRDEMHLFVDGLEVPNINKYGQIAETDKFRTINTEEIIGLSNRDIVSSIDLHTTMGSTAVSSSLSFNNYQIDVGDTINIDEVGFNSNGYTIVNISGQILQLSEAMPATLTNAKFSINRTNFVISSNIDTAPNIAVSVLPWNFVLDNLSISGNIGENIITDNSTDFTAYSFGAPIIVPGSFLVFFQPEIETIYTIIEVNEHTLTLSGNLPVTISGARFKIYDPILAEEITGLRALRPSYSISKDGYYNNIITLSNNVYAEQLILIKTLGLNSRGVKKQHYIWSNNLENVLMTRLPPPISLDEANITKVVLSNTAIGPTNSILSAGVFSSNNLLVSPLSDSESGRTLSVMLSGNNTDFSSNVSVVINGNTEVASISESIVFTDYDTQDTINKFISVNYVTVAAKPIDSARNALVIGIKEKYPITYSEESGLVPVIKYSYYMGGGSTLQDDGYGQVRDNNFLFSGLDIGNYLVINSPVPVAGFYIITGLSADRKSITVKSTNQSTPLPLPSFTDGYYQILNVNGYRSGLQNGFFTFESSLLPSQAYFLKQGFYELEYSTYAKIKLDPINVKMYFGSNFQGSDQINCIVDQIKIYSTMLTDTRIGESIPSNQRSITKDFNSLKPLTADINTLMLLNFDDFPPTNSAKFYTATDNKKHFLSSETLNENFQNSVVILDDPIVLSNDGILDTRKQGTIEFWMNPMFDTSNDPNTRFYFDAYGAIVEEITSIDNTSIKLKSPASKILSVKLLAGDRNTDYFAGGSIEIDTQHAIQEEKTSISDSIVITDRYILQVISVKILGDFSEIDYFEEGSIGTDKKTIYLGKVLPAANTAVVVTYQTSENRNTAPNSQIIRLNRKLPYQNSRVVVNYIPKGLKGDRLCIFKDRFGYMNFVITATGVDYAVRAPIRWAKNTWHRVKASYKINSGKGNDELRLFLDGYQYNNVAFGPNAILGSTLSWGAAIPGDFNDGYVFSENIKFKDSINTLFIGSQYNGESPIFALLNNFKVSNISRPIYSPYNEPLDVNYSTNLETVLPVTEDLFTTYLMSFNKMVTLNTDFSILKNRQSGIFDFSVNILDSLGIVNDSIKSKEVLEKLIKVLKPANSRVFIQYTK